MIVLEGSEEEEEGEEEDEVIVVDDSDDEGVEEVVPHARARAGDSTRRTRHTAK